MRTWNWTRFCVMPVMFGVHGRKFTNRMNMPTKNTFVRVIRRVEIALVVQPKCFLCDARLTMITMMTQSMTMTLMSTKNVWTMQEECVVVRSVNKNWLVKEVLLLRNLQLCRKVVIKVCSTTRTHFIFDTRCVADGIATMCEWNEKDAHLCKYSNYERLLLLSMAPIATVALLTC